MKCHTKSLGMTEKQGFLQDLYGYDLFLYS